MRHKERMRVVMGAHKLPAVGLVRMDCAVPPLSRADLHVQVVLQQALARIGEAGRRFAQCLFETHR